MPEGRALRGHAAAAHSREHARTHAPRNLAAIHRRSAEATFARAFRASRCARRSSSDSPARRRRIFNRCSISFARRNSSGWACSAYSQEEGTRAGQMAGQISDKVKQKRRQLAMAAQHEIAVQVSESFVGREIKVLVEGEASAKELKSARISSWEHGLIRGTDEHASATQRPLSRRARRSRRAGHRWPRLCARQAAHRRICAGENHRPHGLRFDCRASLTADV